MQPITHKLYQFSVTIPQRNFTIHPYLLATQPSILFATGTVQQAKAVLPEIREILGDWPLDYIFVSHMESDECGGLSVLLQAYPEVTVLCSGLAARELPGYGYTGKLRIGREDEELREGDLNLRFFDYPAEVHLQNGLLCYEQNRGIFYSADLMLRFGDAAGQILDADWLTEVAAIGEDRVANAPRLRTLQDKLRTIRPSFVAVGHGYCLRMN